MLLYAVVQFVSGSAGTLAEHCVFIVAVLVPPIAVFFVEATLSDLALAQADPKTHQPLQPLWDWANRLSVPIALVVVIVCGAVWHIGRKTRSSASSSGHRAQRLRTAFPYVTVVVVISLVIRSVTALPVRNPGAHLVSGEAWLWVVVCAVLMLIQSTALSLQQGVELADVDADQPSHQPARPSA
jgi:hypothetical protein